MPWDVLEMKKGLPGGYVDPFLVGTGIPEVVPTERLEREFCYLFAIKVFSLGNVPVYTVGVQASILCSVSTDEDCTFHFIT